MPFPLIQDPAESFLLKQSQVLCSPPRALWPANPDNNSRTAGIHAPIPRQRTVSGGVGHSQSSIDRDADSDIVSLVPHSVHTRDRKSSKHYRVEETVVRGPVVHDLTHEDTSNSNQAGSSADRIPSPEESAEWKRRKSIAEQEKRRREIVGEWDLDRDGLEGIRRGQGFGSNGKGKGKMRDVTRWGGVEHGKNDGDDDEVQIIENPEEEDEDEDKEMCVICLQGLRDKTILGTCGHRVFCFSCINVWANQRRTCPLCHASMAEFLLHDLDSPLGPTKFYLPPKPTIHPSSNTFASTLSLRPHIPAFRQRGPEILHSERGDVWGRLKREREGNGVVEAEEMMERMVERRREVYRFGLFAKHIASNIHTRHKPPPAPRQFAENPDMIVRATAFLRRELRVWRNIDVEFLTTYIISLMRSVDIRSEPAIRLLADFLDQPGAQGRDRRGAEHFAHEVYSFLRSPYRDLALYDAIAQYDPIPDTSAPNATTSTIPQEIPLPRINREDSIPIESRPDIDTLDEHVELDDLSSVSSLSDNEGERPSKRRRMRSFSISSSSSYDKSRPRRNSSRRDLGVRDRRASPLRRLERDTWIAPDILEEMQAKRAKRRNREEEYEARRRARVEEQERKQVEEKRLQQQRKEELAGKGMRGWGERGSPDEVETGDDERLPSETLSWKERAQPKQIEGGEEKSKPSLSMRIFGTASEDLRKDLKLRLQKAVEEQERQRQEQNTKLDLPSTLDSQSAIPALAPKMDVETDEAFDDEIWGMDHSVAIEDVQIKEAQPLTEQMETAPISKAKQAILNLEKSRAERKERILSRLVREKLRKKKDAVMDVYEHHAVGQILPKEQARPVPAQEITRNGKENLLPPGTQVRIMEQEPQAIAVDLSQEEAKARTKLRLKMKLAKAKKEAQSASFMPVLADLTQTLEVSNGLPFTGQGNVNGQVEDREAALRRKLMETKARKRVEAMMD